MHNGSTRVSRHDHGWRCQGDTESGCGFALDAFREVLPRQLDHYAVRLQGDQLHQRLLELSRTDLQRESQDLPGSD